MARHLIRGSNSIGRFERMVRSEDLLGGERVMEEIVKKMSRKRKDHSAVLLDLTHGAHNPIALDQPIHFLSKHFGVRAVQTARTFRM